MRTTILALLVAITVSSCEKDDNCDRKCPVVAASAVPVAVKASFTTKYPSDAVLIWFQKDDIGFCALFKKNGSKKTLAQFGTDGSFVKEGKEDDDDEDDNNSTTAGSVKAPTMKHCKCEVHD